MCLSKNRGGLGIKDLSIFNEALLGKWGWELANNHNQLWVRVLISKYGGWNALCYDRDSAHLSHWWKDLKAVFQQHQSNSIINNFTWKVGDGSKIKFWKDKWRDGGLSLQDKYPSLYQVSTQQKQSCQMANWMGGMEMVWVWQSF